MSVTVVAGETLECEECGDLIPIVRTPKEGQILECGECGAKWRCSENPDGTASWEEHVEEEVSFR